MGSYRLKEIQVRSDWAISQISFIYDDGQKWSVGNKFAATELQKVILDTGEYLVRVTHEKLVQVSCFGRLQYTLSHVYDCLKLAMPCLP